MNAPDASSADRVLSVEGGDIAVRIYAPKTKGKPGVLVFLGGDRNQVAQTAAAAGCIVVSLDANVEQGSRLLSWLRTHARELGGDGSKLALGGAQSGAAAALGVARATKDIRLLVLASPQLQASDIDPARLPSTFIEVGAAGDTGTAYEFVAALLNADIEVQAHISSDADVALRLSLRAAALKRAFAQ